MEEYQDCWYVLDLNRGTIVSQFTSYEEADQRMKEEEKKDGSLYEVARAMR